jgi:protein TonB
MKTEAEVFNQAAVAAAKQWTFKPAVLNGKPVAVWVMVPFRFKLSDGKGEAPSMGVPVKAPDKPAAADIQETKPPSEYTPYEKAPEVIKQVQPQYPADAKKSKIEGTVWVKVWIDETGKAKKAGITKSERPELNKAALDAVMKWEFKPALLNGKPVAVWINIPFKFALK